MIKNPEILEQIELEYAREHPLTLEQKFALMNAMYEHAKLFGHFKQEYTLEDLDTDIAVAKILNAKL